MSLHSTVVSCARTVAACLAIVSLAVVAFLVLPESLLYNDYVAGAILGGTILFVTAVVRVAHPRTDRGHPVSTDR